MSDAWLSEEQKLLRDSAVRYIEREYGFDARRVLSASDEGFGRDHWQRFAEFRFGQLVFVHAGQDFQVPLRRALVGLGANCVPVSQDGITAEDCT